MPDQSAPPAPAVPPAAPVASLGPPSPPAAGPATERLPVPSSPPGPGLSSPVAAPTPSPVAAPAHPSPVEPGPPSSPPAPAAPFPPGSAPQVPAPGPVGEGEAAPGGRLRWPLWAVALGLTVLAAALAHLVAGQERIVLSVSPALLVAETGALLMALAATVAAVRRWGGRKERHARLQAQREAWSQHQQFLRRLDHELKNPLTAVRAAVADMPQANRAERKARLEVVDAQARRMGRLITDLRKLAELETAPLALEDVDLAETVADAVQAVSEELAASGNHTLIRLDLPQVPWPLPHVCGDGDLLYSAIYNVLSNAAKYTPAGGSIEVRGREEAGTVAIEVADTGIGVPAADLPVVWSELGRAGNARGLPGSGLGLPLVATIIRRHRGRAGMASRQGVGTRVWLSLPVAGPRQAGDSRATASQ
ncbi:sensor histidine kinase [Actinomyces capricornis]|uniref:sensor histidine kinase n=1 Tax=Actinomyces capricornis TaxID=2755559 RepID=UPI001CC3854F|nr:HAMP domain-containing sensor histidine kinase [Actinomyces capricornis]